MSAAPLVLHRGQSLTFEERLRETLRNMPYLGLALLVHALLLLLLSQMRGEEPAVDSSRAIVSHAVEKPAPLPPTPPPVPPLVPPATWLVETPNSLLLAEAEPTAEVWLAPALAATFAPDLGADAVIGVGAGPSGAGGPRGGPPGGIPASAHESVLLGLEWLAHHQDPAGFWSGAEFSAQCGRQGSDTSCDGRGSPLFDVGLTALSLLAFLGAGATDQYGEHAGVVKRGLRYLVDVQAGDGGIGSKNSTQGTYDHALATLALSEAWVRGGSPALRRPARAAVAHLLALRTPGSGWRYAMDHPEMLDPTRRADPSVTGWALLALITARKGGLAADERALETALEDGLLLLDERTDPVTGRTGYLQRGGAGAREAGSEIRWPAEESEALTAVAVLCRALADPDLQRPHAAERVAQGAALVAALPPLWSDERAGRRDYYFWYYGAYALFQAGTRPQWKAWEDAIFAAVLPHQHRQGERRGSWDPQMDPWGGVGGRVYSTAVLTLLLEVYYRYPRLLAEHR